MKPILSILLINIIFVALCQIGEPIESSESLLSENEMNNFRESLNKIKKIEKYLRKLEVDTSESGEESEESESSGEESSEIPPRNDVIPTNEPSEQVTGNHGASVHIKKLNSFKNKTNSNNPQKPLLFEFNLFIEFINIKPYKTVRFTLIIYRSRLRELQGGNQNTEETLAVCTRNDTFQDINIKYDCQADAAEASANPQKIETLKDFQVTTDDNDTPSILEAGDLNLSPTAQKALEDLTAPQSPSDYIVDIKDATVTGPTNNIFYIKGPLNGEKKGEIVKPGEDIIFHFSNETMNGIEVNTTCSVDEDATADNFILKCTKPSNFYGTLYLYQCYGTLDGIDIYVNTMEGNDTIKFTSTTSGENVIYRKNSSGLSGGAIAGIVIACAAVLIIVTVLALYLKGPKTPVNNNSTVVGLKSVENYQE